MWARVLASLRCCCWLNWASTHTPLNRLAEGIWDRDLDRPKRGRRARHHHSGDSLHMPRFDRIALKNRAGSSRQKGMNLLNHCSSARSQQQQHQHQRHTHRSIISCRKMGHSTQLQQQESYTRGHFRDQIDQAQAKKVQNCFTRAWRTKKDRRVSREGGRSFQRKDRSERRLLLDLTLSQILGVPKRARRVDEWWALYIND